MARRRFRSSVLILGGVSLIGIISFRTQSSVKEETGKELLATPISRAVDLSHEDPTGAPRDPEHQRVEVSESKKTLRGSVTDRISRVPLEGVTIQLTYRDSAESIFRLGNRRGEFSFELEKSFEGGTLSCSKDGYLTLPTLDISIGELETSLNITLNPTTVLEGWVLSAQGSPLENAEVTVFPDENADRFLPTVSCRSDSQGSFLLETLPRGVPLRVKIDAGERGKLQRAFTLHESYGRLEFILDRPHVIFGQVSNSDGEAEPNALIRLDGLTQMDSEKVRESATASPSGSYSFLGLPSGTYKLSVFSNPDEPPLSVVTVYLGPEMETKEVPLQIPPSTEIWGVVETREGKPLNGISLSLKDGQGNRDAQTARTDGRGRFRFRRAYESGPSVLIVAESLFDGFPEVNVSFDESVSLPIRVTLDEAAQGRLKICYSSPPKPSAIILRRHGKLLSRDVGLDLVRDADEGTDSLRLEVGEYELELRNENRKKYWATQFSITADAESRITIPQLEVSAEKETEAAMERSAMVTVSTADLSRPVHLKEESSKKKSFPVLRGGKLVFENLLPGRYFLQAGTERLHFSLEPGQQRTFDLEEGTNAEFEGRLTDPDGNPVKSILGLTALSLGGSESRYRICSIGSGDGRFRLVTPEAGQFLLIARLGNGDMYFFKAAINPGPERVQDIPLHRTSVVIRNASSEDTCAFQLFLTGVAGVADSQYLSRGIPVRSAAIPLGESIEISHLPRGSYRATWQSMKGKLMEERFELHDESTVVIQGEGGG